MRPDSCVHYTGALNPRSPTCKEGVNYRKLVGGTIDGWVTRLPCMPMELRGEGQKAVCPKFRAPTPEEIAADKRETDEAVKKMMVAYTGKVREWREAQKWSKKNPVSATGKVSCEACGTGEIHLSMSGYNGHIWGKCTTDGCVSWME